MLLRALTNTVKKKRVERKRKKNEVLGKEGKV